MQRGVYFQLTAIHHLSSDDPYRTRRGAPPWTPNTDVLESSEGLLVRVELAGVSADSIELLVEDQTLQIRGIRRDPHSSELPSGYRFRQLEIDYGSFERVIALPFPVDGAHASASLHQGILTVRLPRAVDRPAHTRIRLGESP